ncbi:MAG TPA: hypothetical protein VGO34_11825 [Alphaproteobacteria bacterium]
MTVSDASIAQGAAPAPRPSRPADGRMARLLWAVLLALFAAFLLYVGIPRLIAAVLRVPGDAGLSALNDNEPTSVGVMDAVIDSRQAAGRWIESGRNSNAVGLAAMQLLSMMELLPVRQPGEEARYLAMGIDALQDGLAQQPAQPYAWYQLALALLKRGGDGDAARAERAWRMAVVTGPNEPALIVPRVALGLVIWPQAVPRTRQIIADEVERAALAQPRGLARLSLQLGVDDFMRATLAGKPNLLATYAEMARLPEAGAPLFP